MAANIGHGGHRLLCAADANAVGSCNATARSIRLNTEMAKKPRECLEYMVVHELVHLLEPTHNARFVALMKRFMPRWQDHRKALNRQPVQHEEWEN